MRYYQVTRGVMLLKKVFFFAFCFFILVCFIPTNSYGCELIVNEQGKWVNEDGSEVLQRDIDACLEGADSMTSSGKFFAVLTILFMMSVPLTIFTFAIVVLFAVQKKKLKGPLILFAIPLILSLAIFLFVSFQ